MPVNTIEWKEGAIQIIDQTLLPQKLVYLNIYDPDNLCEAIRRLQIRGAPAIGVAGAMGVALSARNFKGKDTEKLIPVVKKAIQRLAATRPTAVNLFWALDRMDKVLEMSKDASVQAIIANLECEALTIYEEDKEICRKIGQQGALLLSDDVIVLTHCNAGGLATADFGTALGIIYAAHKMGKRVKVYADETRPLLQGARLTSWELHTSGIDVQVICDSTAGFLMRQEKIDCILVGADRIASNGDVANKIGTYSLAVLAEKHKVAFYVAAPVSSFDLSISSGKDIPIEERAREEISHSFGHKTVPDEVEVYNPAFDVTPGDLISAIVTEKGVLYPPLKKSIADLLGKA